MNEGRLKYLDLAKGVGIILVILGHISYLSENSRIFIVSFHMPLFFVISGILIYLKKEESRDFKENAVRKANRMLIPYFAYSAAGIVIYYIYYLLTGRDGGIPTVISDIVQTLTLYGFSVMWFLPAIFGAELLFIFLLKKTRYPLPITIVLTAAALILNIYLEKANAVYGLQQLFSIFHLVAVMLLRIPVCASFVAAGYFVSQSWENTGSLGPGKFSKITIPADIFLGVDFMILTAVISHLNSVTDLHFLIFNNVIMYYIAALAGSFGLIFLCKAAEGACNMPPLKLITYFGKNSLIIMVTHLNFYVLLCAEIGGFHFTKAIPEGVLKHFVFMALVVIFTLCGEIVLIEVINRGTEKIKGISR
ncbi:MAG: acyltransferase [Lachnospiraceae bacterium]|nr:acyltransferase [Lachnospiraceae bacterium]